MTTDGGFQTIAPALGAADRHPLLIRPLRLTEGRCVTNAAVIGAGGIGCLLAAHLQEAGHEVTLCARRPLDRLTIEAPTGRRTLGIRTIIEPDEAFPTDWVLLATKAHQTEGASDWLERLAGPESVVVVLQNGIDRASRVAPFTRRAKMLPALVHTYAEAIAPGHVLHSKGEDLVVPQGETGARFAGLLDGSGLRVVQDPDFLTATWRKLLGNLAASPITALTGRRGEIMHDAEVLQLAAAIMREAADVARAEGAHVDEGDVEGKLDVFRRFPPQGGTSMLFDRLAGRPLEHDVITGAVVDAGCRHGIPTPLNSAMLALLRAVSG